MAVNTAAALRKLQSGQTLNAAEKAALGIGPAVAAAPTVDPLQKFLDTSAARIKELDKLQIQTLGDARTTIQSLQTVESDASPPAINNRNIKPTENPGEGYQWTWFSEDYAKNPYGGQWVKKPIPGYDWSKGGGGAPITTTPGSTGQTVEGGPTLALNTFKNTLALFFGAQEMSQSWVNALYKSVSGFYNTGSTIDESLNLSLRDVRNNPELKPFTDRFKGIYALQDRLAAGEAVTVPTIAEYFKTEAAMGNTLRNVGLGELATQNFLGDIISKGKSLLEVTNLIDNVFNAIDNAPDALKKDLQTYFPGVDRTSLAKALLTGKEGWAELDKKVKGISVLSAAKTQGVTVDLPTASDLALLGTDYAGALSGFQQVKELERGRFLGQTQGIDLTQQEKIGATFKKDAAALAKLEKIRQGEYAKFSGSSGRLASRERGSAGLFQYPERTYRPRQCKRPRARASLFPRIATVACD